MLSVKARAAGRGSLGLICFLCHLVDYLHDIHALPGNRARQDLPHDDGCAVDVDAHTLRLRQHHLGRHVLRCARYSLGSWKH
jgi:hypothetical protein